MLDLATVAYQVGDSLNRDIDRRKAEVDADRERKRQDAADKRAQERHDIAMADDVYRQASRLPPDEVLARLRRDAEFVQWEQEYGKASLPPAEKAREHALWKIQNDRTLGEQRVTRGAHDIAAAGDPTLQAEATNAAARAATATSKAAEAAAPTVEQAREAAALQRGMDKMRAEREKLLLQDQRFKTLDAADKREIDQFSRDVETAVGRFLMDGDAEGLKNVYNRYDDGVEVADVQTGEDGSVTVKFSNGATRQFRDDTEAATFAYSALLAPEVLLKIPSGKQGNSARIQEVEWLRQNLGVDPERAWAMANEAKSDPRGMVLKLYQDRRKDVEDRFGDETEDDSMRWAQDAVNRLMGMQSSAGGAGDIAGAVAPPGGDASLTTLPKVGDVVDGFRFLGGDPASERSWAKVR